MTPEERAALAAELERLVSWSALALEEDASGSDLLEDLEERLIRVAARLRGQEVLPHSFHHPMPEEV